MQETKYLEAQLAQKTQNISMSYGSMHIEVVKKLQEFQDIEVLFA